MQGNKQSKFVCLASAAFFAVLCIPEIALAGGITEFANPVQQVVDTLRGPTGKSICVFMLILAAIGYWFNRGDELSGMMKVFLGVVVIITIVAFSDTIVGRLFTFSGAML